MKAGEIQERIGHCLYRAAFQAETQEEFRQRLERSIEAYEEAHAVYRKLVDEQKVARMFRCKAAAKYIGYWLTSDPSEKRKLLDECLELEGKALSIFSGSGDMLEYGRTYNELPLVFFCRGFLEWNRETLKSIVEWGLEWGEKAVAALSEIDNLYEIAKTYFILGTCLSFGEHCFIAELEDKEKNRLKAVEYLSKTVDISEKVGDAFLLGLSQMWLGTNTGEEESIKHFEKTLEYGKQTRDNFLVAGGLDWLAFVTYWKASAGEDPEKFRQLAETAMQFYNKAQHHYSIMSFMSPRNGLIGPPAGYAEHYRLLADWETDPKERRELLEKSEKAAMEALKLAEDSDMPIVIGTVLHVVSNSLLFRAIVESDLAEKRSLLERALKYREKNIEILEELTPFNYWNLGVLQKYLAGIKWELAQIEPDPKGKRNLLEEAVSIENKCLKLCSKMMPCFEKIGNITQFATLQAYQDDYTILLMQLYELTTEPEYLRKAIEISQRAIESAGKLNMNTRMAESYWKIAKAHDILGEDLKAAENFERASESYMLAAEKIPQLSDFYSDYVSYMKAWAELEKSRHERENENYAQSREHYRKCSHHLETAKRWSYLSTYYFAWSLLEHGEELSRLNKPQDAMKAFNEAGRTFGDSVNSLRKKIGKLEDSEERDEVSKLAAIARVRKHYCIGRALMEEARLLSKKGERISSAEKYASAARIFEGIAPSFEREEARMELEFAATLCQAWEKMELAEERRKPTLFRKAAELFAKAGEITPKKRAGLIAVGNSCFCEALELGTKFMATSNMDFYSSAKLRLQNAAGYYQRAGFEKAALSVEATKRLFDAHVFAGKAEAEVEPKKRARLYLVAEECLGLSANLYRKAGYPDRRNEVLQSLERVKKERRLALSFSEVLTAPTVLSSTTGVSMPDSTEKAAGLNEFESVNVRARLSVPKEFIPGEEFQVKLDLVNVGKKPGLLVRVEGLTPRRCKVLKVSPHGALEDDSLNMRGRRLDPLSMESISVCVQVEGVIGVSLSPKVVYVDDLGNFKTTRVEQARILPVVEFESRVAQVVFSYLVDAFVEDSVRLRLSVEEAGWRSFPQIIKGAGVSKRSVYGAGGRLGSGLSELRRKGLVDLKTFRGRGRGGHILRVRIYHEKDLVRRYVKEKAPDLSV